MACRVRGFRGDDVCRKPEWDRLSEGSGSKNGRDRKSDDALQPGSDLEEGAVELTCGRILKHQENPFVQRALWNWDTQSNQITFCSLKGITSMEG